MTIEPFRDLPFSLRQLQYAVAVSETGGFGAAARACAVSQPSLSAQVAKLEQALGCVLFERSPRGVHPTEAGRALLPRLRDVLQGAREVAEAARVLADPLAPVLRVGVIPTVAPYLLPAVVERLVSGAALPRVHWIERQTRALEQALLDGEIDAILVAEPTASAGLVHVELAREPFLVVVPEAHPLRGVASLDDLTGRELLLLEEGHCLREQAIALCLLPGAQESPFRATSLPTLVQMVASGLGVSVLPAMALPVEQRRAAVRAVPFAEADIGRALYLWWRASTTRSAVLGDLVDLVQAALTDVLAGPKGRGPR